MEDQTKAQTIVDPEALDATQNLIIRLTQQLEDLEKQQKDIKDMLKGVFDNDEALAKAQEVAEEQLKTAKSRRTEIAGSQQAIDFKVKIADLAEDIKMIMESLNTHLLNYYQLTGSQTVDFPGGEEREMVIKAKLKKGAPKQE
jgi:predicted  nucleic acid-binding Zn-ribbon protein